jgi:hypothetical protein
MMKKDLSDKRLIVVIFLSILMLLTPSANAYRYISLTQQPKVFTERSTKTMEIAGKKVDFKQLAKVTYYSNGTTDVHFSITVENISGQIPRIQINFSKTVSTDTRTSKVSNIQSTAQASYAGNLQEYPWDGLWSVISPGNATYWIKYNHDNNYWRYYPFEWNRQWDMDGIEKTHVHLAASDMYAWINQEISDEEMMGKIVGGGSLALKIIGTVAATAIVFFMHNLVGLVIAILVAALAQIFAWLLEVLGITNKSQWIKDNVQLTNNDGFAYYWGFRTIDVFGLVINPPLGPVGCGVLSYNDLYTLLRFHRVGLFMQETREFYQTWGAERDNSPARYTVDICYKEYVNPRILWDISCYNP